MNRPHDKVKKLSVVDVVEQELMHGSTDPDRNLFIFESTSRNINNIIINNINNNNEVRLYLLTGVNVRFPSLPFDSTCVPPKGKNNIQITIVLSKEEAMYISDKRCVRFVRFNLC